MYQNALGILPACQLIATGGTIAMKIDPASGAAVPALSGSELLAAVPGLDALARVDLLNLCNVPSSYMDAARWMVLKHAVDCALARPAISGVVISHGTDTLEETAWFLDQTVDSNKPVVLVGAQRNASEADFDGPRNLLAGIRTSIDPAARGRGVLVVMNDRISSARQASKAHTTAVEAFGPGEAGFAGVVEAGKVIFFRQPARSVHIPLSSTELARVDIVPMYAGADGQQVDAALNSGAKAIVIEALGLGNVNAEMYNAIVRAVAARVAVVISSRVGQGRVRPLYGFTGGGHSLQQAGALFAGSLSAHKARISTMLALQAGMMPQEMQAMFDS